MMKSDRFLNLASEESRKFSDYQHQYGMENTDSFSIDQCSTNFRDEDFYSGVFVVQKNKKYWMRKYWIEEKTGCNCFMLFARELGIIWIQDNRYWTWCDEKETSDADADVAELLDVCWLDVHGKLEASFLSPGTIYEVAFVVKLNESARGWNIPVNLKLVSSDGNVQERSERLQGKPIGQWMELYAGEFRTSSDKSGEIQFWLYEHGGHWKSGLSVKGAIIRPKISE